jgi:hypothetical protein
MGETPSPATKRRDLSPEIGGEVLSVVFSNRWQPEEDVNHAHLAPDFGERGRRRSAATLGG